MIVLIDNYDSFTFNLVHYLGDLGADVVVHRNDKVSARDVIDADPDAIVLSPGPCTPNEAGICLELVGQAGVEAERNAAGVVGALDQHSGEQTVGELIGKTGLGQPGAETALVIEENVTRSACQRACAPLAVVLIANSASQLGTFGKSPARLGEKAESRLRIVELAEAAEL
jgi:hypothetical protein